MDDDALFPPIEVVFVCLFVVVVLCFHIPSADGVCELGPLTTPGANCGGDRTGIVLPRAT
jgi:hypothetical protein